MLDQALLIALPYSTLPHLAILHLWSYSNQLSRTAPNFLLNSLEIVRGKLKDIDCIFDIPLFIYYFISEVCCQALLPWASTTQEP